ncbi:uncharacterized protein LOC116204312 [Punica granatum]|uniref:Uncharacterized protein LOC116204312 n=1 Tax=Punica granatum TaxID=22663 RepID=A0A6P8D583_PUNGR|nr:uncharacterized protein LOC116204312 [Punica granatum]
MNFAGANNNNTPTPTPSTRESTPSSSTLKAINRGKYDPAWAHCKEVPSANGRKGMLCLYCSKVLSDGGINQFKQHLAGLKGNAEACHKVPDPIRFEIQEHLVGHMMENKRKRDMLDEENPYAQTSEHDDEIQAINAIASMGAGYKGPGFHDLPGYLLTKNVEDVRKEVVLFVSQENVVHFVTDNAVNYVAVGRLLEQEFKMIFWSHCIV